MFAVPTLANRLLIASVVAGLSLGSAAVASAKPKDDAAGKAPAQAFKKEKKDEGGGEKAGGAVGKGDQADRTAALEREVEQLRAQVRELQAAMKRSTWAGPAAKHAEAAQQEGVKPKHDGKKTEAKPPAKKEDEKVKSAPPAKGAPAAFGKTQAKGKAGGTAPPSELPPGIARKFLKDPSKQEPSAKKQPAAPQPKAGKKLDD